MPSKTDLFNAALAAIGEDTLVSDADSDTGRPAKILRARWPAVQDALLRAHPWNCAIRRETLAPAVKPPDWGFQNYFTWPADPYCLRILGIANTGADFQIEGRKIAANSSTLGIKYVARIEVSEFDALLYDVAVDALASEAALPIAGSVEMKDQLYKTVYGPGGKLANARTIDGMEGKSRRSGISPLVDVRQTGSDVAGPIEWMNR